MASSNMIVQHNMAAMNTHRNMKNVGVMQSKASEKLSSGYRINTAADDAAGLAISEKMRSQIRGLNMASKNVSDAISLIKTAEGGMQGIDDMLHRIRELTDYAANDTNEMNSINTSDRQKIQDEIDQLIQEIDDMSERVEFNRKKLINGSFQDTKEQLANAKEVFDRTAIDVASATAKKGAIEAALGAETDVVVDSGTVIEEDGDPQPDPLPTENAYAVRNFYQAVLDHTTHDDDAVTTQMTLGSIDRYKSAVADMSQAQSVYDVAVAKYEAAKAEVNKQLSLAGRTLEQLDKAFYTDSANNNALQVAQAIGNYMDVASELGIDELKLQSLYDATVGNGVIGTSDDETGFAAFMLEAYNTGGVLDGKKELEDGDFEFYPTTWSDAQKMPADDASATAAVEGAAIETYLLAKQTFAIEEGYYKAAVAARDLAQSTVDTLEQRKTEATREVNTATTIHRAADISYTAANNLHLQGQSKSLHFQVGANGNQSLIMSIGSLKSDTLGIGDGHGKSYISVLEDSGQDITSVIDVLDTALSYVTTERSKLGAAQNRMEYTQSSLDITAENIQDAESRIRDADMAQEMMNFTKANVLQQVSVSMMAQANQLPQSVLQLLR